MKALTIAIVDDHLLFRKGFRLILGELSVVGDILDFSSGDEYLSYLTTATTQPHITFMDIEMEGKNGIETTKEALTVSPGLKIIALSMYSDAMYYKQMIIAGAKGFLLKNSDIYEVERAIEDLSAGKQYFSNALLSEIFTESSKTNDNTLSSREMEVLHHICKGLSNPEIAKTLHLSKRTIDKHRENILSKTGCNNTAALVMYAIRNGIINL